MSDDLIYLFSYYFCLCECLRVCLRAFIRICMSFVRVCVCVDVWGQKGSKRIYLNMIELIAFNYNRITFT